MDQGPIIHLFKILGQPERYAILRRLMAAPASLSQLGQAFEQTPAHIRHHLKVLEQAGLVEFAEARVVQGGPEKYYRATQRAIFIHQAVLPEAQPGAATLTIGSMDSAIRHLAGMLAQQRAPVQVVPVPISSLDGLIALRQGLCQMSASHLLDPGSQEYNRSFVRHVFPGQPMALVQVFGREEGLIVQPGNPLGIRELEDLTRPAVRFVNREAGSGVRQWLDLQLNRLGIGAQAVRGYGQVVHSHHSVARAIRDGQADTGVGIAASAREFGLDFLPLLQEPYEIVMPVELLSDPRYAPFFDAIQSGEFRNSLRGWDGYVVPQDAGGVEIIR